MLIISIQVSFPKGQRREQFGSEYSVNWFDYIRKGTSLPFEKGVITYYRLFENIWKCDFYKNKTDLLEIPLGEGQVSFDYNPKEPPAFCEEGALQRNHFASAHVISLYTSPLDTDVFVKGKMEAILRVSSTCPDTSFYISVSIKKLRGIIVSDTTSHQYPINWGIILRTKRFLCISLLMSMHFC